METLSSGAIGHSTPSMYRHGHYRAGRTRAKRLQELSGDTFSTFPHGRGFHKASSNFKQACLQSQTIVSSSDHRENDPCQNRKRPPPVMRWAFPVSCIAFKTQPGFTRAQAQTLSDRSRPRQLYIHQCWVSGQGLWRAQRPASRPTATRLSFRQSLQPHDPGKDASKSP